MHRQGKLSSMLAPDYCFLSSGIYVTHTLPSFSIFESNIPSMAVFADPTSVRRSLAAVFCWASGRANGDSRTGSMGSIGVIRCNNTHNLGSSTSRTLRKLGPLSVKGNCKEKKQNSFELSSMSQNSVKNGKMLSFRTVCFLRVLG